MSRPLEFWLILTVGLIQFVSILDFMMVMPLGPDFAQDLDIPASQVGIIAGSYTFAASLTGLVAALFLDNYCRKTVMMIALAGLLIATAMGALAWDLPSLIAARVLAGIFGGPLSATAMAMIADFIPAERRGAAIGKVMGAFAAASVLGVPFGLELAEWFSWRAPFFVLSVFGCGVMYLVWRQLPKGYSPQFYTVTERLHAMQQTVFSPLAMAGLGLMACSMMAGFMIIPNIAAHVQMNLSIPREHMGAFYLSGGLVSLIGMRLMGRWTDRYTATRVSFCLTALLIWVLWAGFIAFPTSVPIILLFTLFMLSQSGRNVAAQSLTSRIPAASERAGYLSMQSSVTHMAMALGSGFSSFVLHEHEGRLAGVPTLGLLAIGLNLLVPILFFYAEGQLQRRDGKK
jgi:predicted MFS family arabinose efflux permease